MFLIDAKNRLSGTRIETWFLLIASVIGVAMVLATPPLKGFDEIPHFLTANYYAHGARDALPVTRPSAVKPVRISQALHASTENARQHAGYSGRTYSLLWQAQATDQSTAEADLVSSAPYSPMAYAPEIIGLVAGGVLHVPVLVQLYLARLCNLAVYVALVYMAIRFAPVLKWALFAVALLPMSIFQASTVTTDGFLNGLMLLFVALVFWAVARPKGVSLVELKRYGAAIGALAVLIALAKPIYVLVVAVLLCMPVAFYGKKTYRYVMIGSVFAAAGLAAVFWNYHVHDYALEIGRLSRPGLQISASLQVSNLLSHPWLAIEVLCNTFTINSYGYLQGIIGVFDSNFMGLTAVLAVPIVVALYVSVAVDADKLERLFPTGRRWVLLATAAALVLAVCAVFYLTYSSVGGHIIDGIQGRYFIPILVVLLPVLYWRRIAVKIKEPTWLFVPLMAVVLVCAVVQIVVENILLYRFA